MAAGAPFCVPHALTGPIAILLYQLQYTSAYLRIFQLADASDGVTPILLTAGQLDAVDDGPRDGLRLQLAVLVHRSGLATAPR